MAQNITLLGASYSAVPSVTLPKTGGGTASFTDVTDTTATASDVASGKYFYTSSGVRTQGTASGGGGSANIEALSVTQNGTYTASGGVDGYSPVTVNVSGGASNVITGTFTTGSTAGAIESLNIPYNGSGYPVFGYITVNAGWGDTYWKDLVNRYAIGEYSFSKLYPSSAPSFSSNATNDSYWLKVAYKSSASVATSYGNWSSTNNGVYLTRVADPTSGSSGSIEFSALKTIRYFVKANSYGLLPSFTYKYVIVYSS